MSGDPGEAAEAVSELESLGYTSVWIPAFGGTFETIERLLSATSTTTVATGILSVWVSPAEEVAARVEALRRAHGNRFLLGLGVSHAPLVESLGQGRDTRSPCRSWRHSWPASTRPVPR